MNIGIMLLLALPIFYLGYRSYGGYIARTFEENDGNATPAAALQDGNDFVPTPKWVAFSHHFASIAGAGPIVGPVAALAFGYLPAWLWIVLGGVFFGAVHDYTALFISMREKGRSLAEVSDRTLGRAGFILFILFTLALIVLVTSAFLGLTATALTSMLPAAKVGVEAGKTILHTVEKDGKTLVQIGGIASTSVIVMTVFAPVIGYLLYRRGVQTRLVALLAMAVCALGILAGLVAPVSLDPKTWMIILSVYVFVAAGIPVWMLLQPRDFTNAFILYAGIAALAAGILGGIATGLPLQAPAWNVAQGSAKLGAVWPFLFITIACGAISGFHSLVASGTLSKQVARESHARTIGYGGMILESLLAVVVLLAVAGGLNFDSYMSIMYPTEAGAKANPILAFALSMGNLLHNALGISAAAGAVFGILMVEGFVITTLDTAVRLNRYLFEELWNVLFDGRAPAAMRSYTFNAGLSVALMLYLGYTNAFQAIWPIFGSANQLLAALGLITATVWLALRSKPYWFTLAPAVVMLATTLRALWDLLLHKYLPAHNMALVVTDVVLLVLGACVAALAAARLFGLAGAGRRAVGAPAAE